MSKIQTFATGAEIEEIIRAMEPSLNSYAEDKVLMACLALSLIILGPDMSPTQLIEGVAGSSEWMASYVAHVNNDDFHTMSKPTQKIH
jgi:hypothetical protein